MNKQIKELKNMVEILCDARHKFVYSEEMAEFLYNNGYRKSTDVAMEIFEEIEKLLKENLFTLIPPYRSEITDWKTVFRLKLADDIAELKKKYEREGEE